ncbi:hypothetical protein ACJ41O_015277 [Fusarium nematophilum]
MSQSEAIPPGPVPPVVSTPTDVDEGYRKLAAFIARSGDHTIFRKFSMLNVMNILRLQAEVQDLEDQFGEAWKDDVQSGDPIRARYSSSFREMRKEVEDGDSTQYDLLVHISDKLKEYNTALQALAFLEKFPRPAPVDLEFLRLWILREGGGNNFLKGSGIEATVWSSANEEDLVRIQTPTTGNNRLIDIYHSSIGRFRKSKVVDGIRSYNSGKISRLEEGVIVAISAVMPTAAILALYYIRSMLWRMLFVVLLTSLFSILMSLLTGAKRAEIFAATATFAAIEVVYIGSTSTLRLRTRRAPSRSWSSSLEPAVCRHREEYLNHEKGAGFLYMTDPKQWLNPLLLSPLLSAPQIGIPIGQVEYESVISLQTEKLPVVMDLMAYPGCGNMLFSLVEKLAEKGIIKTVKTRRAAF